VTDAGNPMVRDIVRSGGDDFRVVLELTFEHDSLGVSYGRVGDTGRHVFGPQGKDSPLINARREADAGGLGVCDVGGKPRDGADAAVLDPAQHLFRRQANPA
jgi:hypothetical protein